VPRLYANENFPLPVVVELRRLGCDVLTVQETGRADRSLPDDEVLAFATSQRRAALTLNRRHFVRLHQQNPDHGGIVVCTVDPDFTAQAARIWAAIRAYGSDSERHNRLSPGIARRDSKPSSIRRTSTTAAKKSSPNRCRSQRQVGAVASSSNGHDSSSSAKSARERNAKMPPVPGQLPPA
jgi:hypothetical protein